jgi:hypothetical protein
MTGSGTFSGSGYFYATAEATDLALFQGTGLLTGTNNIFRQNRGEKIVSLAPAAIYIIIPYKMH